MSVPFPEPTDTLWSTTVSARDPHGDSLGIFTGRLGGRGLSILMDHWWIYVYCTKSPRGIKEFVFHSIPRKKPVSIMGRFANPKP